MNISRQIHMKVINDNQARTAEILKYTWRRKKNILIHKIGKDIFHEDI